ncbi:hypothetical protein HMPREF1138_1897 [Actinomyces sp. ICM58]|nr:hypothetical protein HMPREF1138_1897 [Actinomyces sp. ICM58]
MDNVRSHTHLQVLQAQSAVTIGQLATFSAYALVPKWCYTI